MRMKLSSLIFLLFIILIGCEDNSVDPNENQLKGIIGKITDINGEPIIDAGLHYIFYTDDNAVYGIISIQFSIEKSQNITIKVYNSENKEIYNMVDNQFFQSGNHGVISRPGLTNGVYFYKVFGEELLNEGSFLIRDDNISNIINYDPLTKSDAKGEFFISYSAMGIGKNFVSSSFPPDSLVNLTIRDSIKLIIHKEEYQIFIEPINIDLNRSISKTFILSDQ